MTRTAVAILDRDNWQANADIVVVVDNVARTLTWLPRDLWSRKFGCRLGGAFKRGGVDQLFEALAEAGFGCDGIVCLRRGAVEAALQDVVVTVPVRQRLDFWYPLEPNFPIEEGRKLIGFVPPLERLAGERIHQWIGARVGVDGRGSDLDRIERQQTLLRELLRSGRHFGVALADPSLVLLAGDDPLAPLRRVDASWSMRTVRGLHSRIIDRKHVLVPTPLVGRVYWRLRRIAGRLLRARGRRDWLVRRRVTTSPTGSLAWGRHVPDDFEAKLRAICGRLGLDPSMLMAIIAFETARSFSPGARNPSTGATGLIQFMPQTAQRLGTTVAQLAAMSALQQLDYVERYLLPYAGRMPSLASAYMAILWPDAISKPPDFVLFAAPSDVYARNAGLDGDKDGKITRLDAASQVQEYLHEGMRPEHAR